MRIKTHKIMPSRFTTNYAAQVAQVQNRKRKSPNEHIPGIFLLIITMVALVIYVQFFLLKSQSQDVRTKAYTQSPTGIRIEAEEMTRSGSVTTDPTGTFIIFQ